MILDRRIAEGGRYPAIDVLRSLSRVANSCLTAGERALVQHGREILSTYADVAELVRLGAYKRGTDETVDMALTLYPRIEAILRQDADSAMSFEASFAALAAVFQEQ